MKYVSMFDKIDLHLIRVLHTVRTGRSVLRAALRLGRHQPVDLPRRGYDRLWRERSHAPSAGRWLREQIKGVAAPLRRPGAEAVA